MRGTQQETVEELKKQIYQLQQRLGDFHASDVNALRRANTALVQHIRQLSTELKDVSIAAAKLCKDTKVKDDTDCTREVAQSIGALWLGGVITFCLKSSLKLPLWSIALAAISAVVPLGVRSCRKMQRVILKNPDAVEDLMQALAVLEQRATIMHDLALEEESPPSAFSAAPRIEHFTAMTSELSSVACVSAAHDPCDPSPMGSVCDDMVHVKPSDWESPRSRGMRVTFDGGDEDALDPVVTGEGLDEESDVGRDGSIIALSDAGHEGSMNASMVSMSEDAGKENVMTSDA